MAKQPQQQDLDDLKSLINDVMVVQYPVMPTEPSELTEANKNPVVAADGYKVYPTSKNTPANLKKTADQREKIQDG